MMKRLLMATVDTGGGVMVNYYEVQDAGELKWIGISDDCIVGYGGQAGDEPWYSDTSNELWVVHTSADQPNIPHGQIYDDYDNN